MSQRDWDAEFEAITKNISLSQTAAKSPVTPVERWEDSLEERRQRTADSEQQGVPGFRDQWRIDDAPQPESGWRQYSLADAAEDDTEDDAFVPPEPTPLHEHDSPTIVMIGSLVVGALWLLYLALFDRYTSMLWWFLACALIVVGFVMAVARQPKHRDDNDEFDDGARL